MAQAQVPNNAERVKIRDFYGSEDEDFDEWETHVRRAASGGEWSDDYVLRLIPYHLKDTANLAFEDLANAQKDTLDNLLSALREKFSSPQHVEVAKAKLRTAAQEPKESVQHFANQILRYVHKGYKDLAPDQRQKKALEAFKAGLLSEYRTFLAIHQPANFEAALQSVLLYEADRDAIKSRNKLSSDTDIETLTKQLFQQVEEKLNLKELPPSFFGRNNVNRAEARIARPSVVCGFCGKVGHHQQVCRAWLGTMNNGPRPSFSQGPMRSGGQPHRVFNNSRYFHNRDQNRFNEAAFRNDNSRRNPQNFSFQRYPQPFRNESSAGQRTDRGPQWGMHSSGDRPSPNRDNINSINQASIAPSKNVASASLNRVHVVEETNKAPVDASEPNNDLNATIKVLQEQNERLMYEKYADFIAVAGQPNADGRKSARQASAYGAAGVSPPRGSSSTPVQQSANPDRSVDTETSRKSKTPCRQSTADGPADAGPHTDQLDTHSNGYGAPEQYRPWSNAIAKFGEHIRFCLLFLTIICVHALRTPSAGQSGSKVFVILATITIISALSGYFEVAAAKLDVRPMVCQTLEGRSVWHLPSEPSCDYRQYSENVTEPEDVTLMLYKRNIIQYKTKAWTCRIVYRRVKTFTYFFNDENLKEEELREETVSVDDCIHMTKFHRCLYGNMVKQGGMFQTTNKLFWEYPGGGVHCCKWKTFEVYNCYAYPTFVYKRHHTLQMESTAGEVTHCKYTQGSCNLKDGRSLIWEVDQREQCEFVEWRKFEGQAYKNEWLEESGRLGLTLHEESDKFGFYLGCKKERILMTPQGIAYRVVSKGKRHAKLDRALRDLRKQGHAKRNTDNLRAAMSLQSVGSLVGPMNPLQNLQLLNTLEKGDKKRRDIASSTELPGPVTSDQLASSLQGVIGVLRRDMRTTFRQALHATCENALITTKILRTSVVANPTLSMRQLLSEPYIYGQASGELIEVWPCHGLHPDNYVLAPMNETCTREIPIYFSVRGFQEFGYLDPTTKIIQPLGTEVDCALVKNIILELAGKPVSYAGRTGEIQPVDSAPVLGELEYKESPMLTLKETVYHQLVMHNWTEVQSQLSLNDVYGAMQYHVGVLKDLEVSRASRGRNGANQLSSNIMHRGQFGFLTGLAIDWKQTWIFAVCIYVTVAAVILHCCPVLRAIPQVPNLPNWTGRVLREVSRHSTNGSNSSQRRRAPPRPSALYDSATLARGVELWRRASKRVKSARNQNPIYGPLSRRAKRGLQTFRRGNGEEYPVDSLERRDWPAPPSLSSLPQEETPEQAKPLLVAAVQSTRPIASVASPKMSTAGRQYSSSESSGTGITVIKPPPFPTCLPSVQEARRLAELTTASTSRNKRQTRNGNDRVCGVHQDGEDDVYKPPVPSIVVILGPKGYQCLGLADTGAAITLVSELLASEAGLQIDENDDTAGHITTVNGQDVKVIGSAVADLTFHPKLSIRQKIYVARLPTYEFIIGREVLFSFKKTVFNREHSCLELDGYALPYTPRFSSDEPTEVFLTEDLKIPPRTRAIVPGAITTKMRNVDLFFEPRSFNIMQNGLFIAKALVCPHFSTIPVQILNTGLQTEKLFKYSTLGLLKPIVTADIRPIGVPNPNSMVSVMHQEPHCDHTSYNRLRFSEQRSKLDDVLDLTNTKLDPTQKKKLIDTLAAHADAFAFDDLDLGTCPLVEHQILTGDAPPIRQRPYRVPIAQKEIIKDYIDSMLKADVIRPSVSPWASPVVLVKKKDGKDRFCVDYRKLNQLTKKDVYPLPRIDDILDILGKAQYFSTLDLRSGYWQIPVAKQDREKTAFVTYHGLFEFNKVPFGLCNAPATFQRLMEIVLAGLNWLICAVYIDDILVFSPTFDEHLGHLEAVIIAVKSAGLKFKPEKCEFARPSIKFLGHIVSPNGIKPDPEKVKAVMYMPDPRNQDEVRSFLGLASYYRRFIRNFAQIAEPLHKLLKKSAIFEWKDVHHEALQSLKQKLSNAPVLKYPDFSKAFFLFTDASGVGIGAILSQLHDEVEHPVVYLSRTLGKSERNYPPIEWEGLAVVWAIKQLRHYLYGRRFTVVSDHAPLQWLMSPNHMSQRLTKWSLALQEYDFDIQHRAGKKNQNADGLSRLPIGEKLNSVNAVLSDEPSVTQLPDLATGYHFQNLLDLQTIDDDYRYIFQYLYSGTLPTELNEAKQTVAEAQGYVINDGLLHHIRSSTKTNRGYGQLQLAVPKPIRIELLEAYHDDLFSGHLGKARTYQKLSEHYFWPGMYTDVSKWCDQCINCAARNQMRPTTRYPLQPLPVEGPFDRVAVDFLGPLPRTDAGNKHIVVFSDYLTKWPEAFATPDQSAVTTAKIFMEEIVCRHAAPRQLLSDRGTNFLSKLVKEVCKLCDTRKVNTTAYHPQTDGLVERFNRTLMCMLAKITSSHQRDWDAYIPFCLFAYRTSAHESARESPFYLIYGRSPRLPIDTALVPPSRVYRTGDDYFNDVRVLLAEAWATAKIEIGKAQHKQKSAYDKTVRHDDLVLNDTVLLYTPVIKTGLSKKLGSPWTGPYNLVQLEGNNAFLQPLGSPNTRPIRVHANRLKRFLLPREPSYGDSDGQEEPEPIDDTSTLSDDAASIEFGPPNENINDSIKAQVGSETND